MVRSSLGGLGWGPLRALATCLICVLQWTRAGMATLAASNVAVSMQEMSCAEVQIASPLDSGRAAVQTPPPPACALSWWIDGTPTLRLDSAAALPLLCLHWMQGVLQRLPLWHNANNVLPFLESSKPAPPACPSIVNAKALGTPSTALPVWACPSPVTVCCTCWRCRKRRPPSTVLCGAYV